MSEDYSFLRTGSNGFYTERTYNIEENIKAILIVLLKNAFLKLDNWCRHRGVINPDTELSFDLVKTFIKIETIIFLDTPNLNERIQETLREVENIYNNFEEELIEISENNQQNNPQPLCRCEDCEIVNNIDTIWDNFNPTDTFIILLKKNINEFSIAELF